MTEFLRSLWGVFVEEFAIMRSGRFIPYHRMSLLVVIVTLVIFSAVFSQSTVMEGQISIIDLDRSEASFRLIERIDNSVYIDVREVFRGPYRVNDILANDRNLGVLLIARDFQKHSMSGLDHGRVVYYADYSNQAQNASVIEQLNVIIAAFSAEQAASNAALRGLSITPRQTDSITHPLSMEVRRLYNPSYSSTNSTIMAFIHFFASIYFNLTTLMLAGRMRVTHRFEHEILGRSIFHLLARHAAYALIYTTSIATALMLMIVFGQLRFAGNFLLYVLTLFLTGMVFAMMAFHISYNAPDPGRGASLMIFIVPPGFIMGGALLATGVLADWAYALSHLYPLVWQYKFFRDIGLRGTDCFGVAGNAGLYLLYFVLLCALAALRNACGRRRLQEAGRMRADSRQLRTPPPGSRQQGGPDAAASGARGAGAPLRRRQTMLYCTSCVNPGPCLSIRSQTRPPSDME